MPPYSLHAPFLLALLSLLSTPEMGSATEPDLPLGCDAQRGGGLPPCQCGLYHNGAWQRMSRMCEYEWAGNTICYPTRVEEDYSQGSVLNGRYYDNSCSGGQTMCSPWTPTAGTFENSTMLKKAVDEYLEDSTSAEEKYGDISLWVTKCVTSMSVRRFVRPSAAPLVPIRIYAFGPRGRGVGIWGGL